MKDRTFLRSALILIALVMLWPLVFNSASLNPISWDAFGYYYYLPMILIQKTLIIESLDSIKPIFDLYSPSSTLYQFSYMENGKFIIRYPIGQAILYLPFFLVGHLFALISDYPVDGFSAPYKWAMNIGGFVFHFAGILLIIPILKRYFTTKIITWTILLLFFTTNIYVFYRGNSLLAHGSLLFLINLFILIFLRYTDTGKGRDMIFSAIVFGLICLNRPTDIVILIPAFLYLFQEITKKNNVTHFDAFKMMPWRHISIFASISLCIGFIQFTYWKIAAGSWLVDSYNNPAEGLDLLSPHIYPFLLSFKSGWFIYTPLMLVVCIAIFVFIFKHKRTEYLPIALYLLIFVYLAGSWTNWWYGSSYSQRAMIQTYGLLAIPLAQMLANLRTSRLWWKASFGTFLLLCTALNMWQSTQYINRVFPTARMTKDYYFASFFDFHADPAKQDLLEVDRYSLTLAGMHELPQGYELLESYDVISQPEFLGNREYSTALKIPFEEICHSDHCWMMLEVLFLDTVPEQVYLATCIERKGRAYGYHAKPAKDALININASSGTLKTRSYYLSPDIRSGTDQFSAYVWNPGLHELTIEHMKVQVYVKSEPKVNSN